MKKLLTLLGVLLIAATTGCAVLDILVPDEPEPRRGTLTLDDGTTYEVEERQ